MGQIARNQLQVANSATLFRGLRPTCDPLATLFKMSYYSSIATLIIDFTEFCDPATQKWKNKIIFVI